MRRWPRPRGRTAPRSGCSTLRDESDSVRDDRLSIDLRRALDRNEIEIRFQPQVSVTDGHIVGVEALARWRHPDHGELGADTLFSIAARSDYLAQLSDHIHRRAIAEAADWPAALASLRVAVNITAVDIVQPGFAAAFLARVADAGFAPGRLTVEVTESGLIEDLQGAAALLAELARRRPARRNRRFRHRLFQPRLSEGAAARLSQDRPQALPGHHRLEPRPGGGRGVIEMARSLGLDVIAEGVETEAQLERLAEAGCTLYQGFLCAPPLETGALAALVAARV